MLPPPRHSATIPPPALGQQKNNNNKTDNSMTTTTTPTTTTTRRTLTAPAPLLSYYGEVQPTTVPRDNTAKSIRRAIKARRHILRMERIQGRTAHIISPESLTVRINQIRNANRPATDLGHDFRKLVASLYETTPRNWRTPALRRAGTVIFPAGECVGVEIEHLLKTGATPFQYLPIAGAKLVGDGSVSTQYGEGDNRRTTPHTMISPFGQEAVMMFRRSRPERLLALCDYLDDMGATVNQTCGLHVHLDQRDVSRREALTRARRIAAALPWLVTIVPPSRRDNDFCRATMSARSRYVAVNCMALDEHNTIEVRLAAGSTDAQKILMWVDLMLYLSRTPKRMTTLEKFLASSAPMELKCWVIARKNKFNPPSGTRTEGSEQ